MKIIYLPDGSLAYENLNVDADNTPVVWMDKGETRTLAVDWSQITTPTSASASAEGCTVSSSLSSTTQTLTISSVNNTAYITLTMSDGTQTFNRQIRARERDRRNFRDYT